MPTAIFAPLLRALCVKPIMKYKHKLTTELIDKAKYFGEFAHGGAQATIKLKDGRVFNEALISNSSVIIAMRNYKDLPFLVSDIADIYQREEDNWPKERGSWEFWDDWPKKNKNT